MSSTEHQRGIARLSLDKATAGASLQLLAPRYWPTWAGLGLLRLASLLPLPWQVAIGAGFGALSYRLMHERRHVTRVNIGLCFPDLDAAAREALVRESFRSTGAGLLETSASWWCSSARLGPYCHIEGLEFLQQALRGGKGAILLTGHSTSLELGGRLLALHVPFQVMYRKIRNRVMSHVILNARRRNYARVNRRDKLRDTLRGLQDNLPTWYAPDQDFGRRGSVFVPFMGVPTATIVASAKLARLSQAPVLPFYPYRLPDGKGYRLVLQPPLEDFPSGDAERDAARVNAVLEKQIAVSPEQYFWAHKRFKTRPPGEPPVY